MPTGSRPQLSERDLRIINKYSAQHGQVRGLELPIADSAGNIGAPLLRLGTLAALERRGAISRAEQAAGDRFHDLFQRGALDALHAADMGRTPVAGGTARGDLSPSGERCRRHVSAAMVALGGAGSPAASAVWHVVGLEWSTRRWAISTRRPQQLACGILIAGLGTLAGHFAGRK